MVCVFNLITAIHDNLKVGYPYNDNRDYLITPHVDVCGFSKKLSFSINSKVENDTAPQKNGT
jgi:hypothetical protein